MLPVMQGFKLVRSWCESPGEVRCELKASDLECVRNITAIAAVLAEEDAASMSCEDAMEIMRRFAISNRCSECGGGEFIRRFYVHEREPRLVDMLDCRQCSYSIRVGDDLSCEGLDPSPNVRQMILMGARRFKRIEYAASGREIAGRFDDPYV
jgi:hypothetical protein